MQVAVAAVLPLLWVQLPEPLTAQPQLQLVERRPAPAQRRRASLPGCRQSVLLP
jgi:hypothetical protein